MAILKKPFHVSHFLSYRNVDSYLTNNGYNVGKYIMQQQTGFKELEPLKLVWCIDTASPKAVFL